METFSPLEFWIANVSTITITSKIKNQRINHIVPPLRIYKPAKVLGDDIAYPVRTAALVLAVF